MTLDAAKSSWTFIDKENFNDRIKNTIKEGSLTVTNNGNHNYTVTGTLRVLTRPAKEITLRTVIDALDVTVLADVHFQEESETPLKTIVNHQLWNPMTTYLRKFCDSITISDMMEQYRTFLSDTEGPMYYI